MTQPHDPDEAGAAPPPELVQVLVDSHRQFLGFLERRVGDRAAAEDLLQEAIVRALPRLAELGSEESVVRWVYRVLRNAAIDHHRRGASARRGLAALASELEGQEEAEPEVREAVCRCIAPLAETLKDEYAHALRRIEIDGIPVKDYAAEVGISPGNAAVRVFRARQALRKRLIQSCGTCAEHGCIDCSCHASDSGCAGEAGAGR